MSGTQGEYIVFNVVQVPISGSDGFEQAFAKRQSRLREVDGFAGFELLRKEGADEYIVVSRWRNEEAFTAWRSSEHFANAHKHVETDDRHDGDKPTGSHVETFHVVLSESANS